MFICPYIVSDILVFSQLLRRYLFHINYVNPRASKPRGAFGAFNLD